MLDKKTQGVRMQGFTLMEMLATIAIIGILSSLVLSSFSGARMRARDSERVTEVGQIVLGVELFYNTCRNYPTTLTAGDTAGGSCPGTITLGTYIPVIPTNPTGGNYGYATASGSFVVEATLETVGHASFVNDIDTGIGAVACDDAGLHFCKGG